MGPLLTCSLGTAGGALLGLLFCVLFAEPDVAAGYMVFGAIGGGIARFLIKEL